MEHSDKIPYLAPVSITLEWQTGGIMILSPGTEGDPSYSGFNPEVTW